MHSLLVNRTIPEDLGEDYFQSQFPDISELPAKEVRRHFFPFIESIRTIFHYNMILITVEVENANHTT